jgi:hypothetical protein
LARDLAWLWAPVSELLLATWHQVSALVFALAPAWALRLRQAWVVSMPRGRKSHWTRMAVMLDINSGELLNANEAQLHTFYKEVLSNFGLISNKRFEATRGNPLAAQAIRRRSQHELYRSRKICPKAQ